MAIEPSPDVYGNKAPASAVADWLELLAWHEQPITLAAAADYFSDTNYGVGILLPGEEYGENEEEELIDWTRTVLNRRIELLGNQYPFEMADDKLSLRKGVDAARYPYILLLSITVAHAYPVETTTRPEYMFEAVVARCMDSRLRSVDLGNLRRSHQHFHDAVMVAGTTVGLDPTPGAASSVVAAQDEGVDTIGHWDWKDARPGRWTLIGQATCGQTTTWKHKMAEPSSPAWRARLGDPVEPLGFLAVPHHVEDGHLYHLVENGGRPVIDRIRLTLCDPEIETDEETLIAEVFNAGVASP